MSHKKNLLIIFSFFVFVFLYSFIVPDVKAIDTTTGSMTVDQIITFIAQLQQQIAQLQQQLAKIEGREVAWCYDFNVSLRYGDKGAEVKALHTALEKEGFLINKSEKENDSFGTYTASGVSGFQVKYRAEVLTPWGLTYGTGFVGKTTRLKFNELYGCEIPTAPVTEAGPIEEDEVVVEEEEIQEEEIQEESYIQVLSPNGGEEWLIGETYNISWDVKGLIDKVDVELGGYDENGNLISQWYTIAENTASYSASLGLGFYQWTIPYNIEEQFQASPTKYKIRVRNSGLPIEVSDESDGYFFIKPKPEEKPIEEKSITVVIPNGGEEWKLGEYNVLKVDVRYTTTEVWIKTDITLVNKETNQEYFIGNLYVRPPSTIGAFLIPESIPPGEHYILRISTAEFGVQGDESDGYFTLSGVEEEPTEEPIGEVYIKVISPNGGEEWVTGNTYPIKWESKGIEKIDISIYMPTPAPGGWPPDVARVIVKDLPVETGEYLWTFEESYYDFLEGSRKLYGLVNPAFKILIFKSGSYHEYDASDDYFSIVETGTTTLKHIENQLAAVYSAVERLLKSTKELLGE